MCKCYELLKAICIITIYIQFSLVWCQILCWLYRNHFLVDRFKERHTKLQTTYPDEHSNTTCAAGCSGASATSCRIKVPHCQLANEGPVIPPSTVCTMSVIYQDDESSSTLCARSRFKHDQGFQSDLRCSTSDVIVGESSIFIFTGSKRN